MNPGLQLTAFGRREPIWPWVLVTLCLICAIMKVAFSLIGPGSEAVWLHFWGFRPNDVMAVLQRPPTEWLDPRLLGIVTALFVHTDWLHLAGNLAYLWVFGMCVERAVGHWRFALLFIVLGSLANLYVALQLPESSLPVIGASGGVSAIIGVYLGLFPRRRIGLWVPLGLYLQFARVPALLVIGSWFTLQLLYSVFGPTSEAVAWWAHISGFFAGLLAAMLLRLSSGSLNLSLKEY
ncbi:MAG: rhomboid family intramembrane serine protease [Wenzhouxiangella sp.]|nr:rhomboid family intramembrane serine protease [Wenzhouxiangella sp.]